MGAGRALLSCKSTFGYPWGIRLWLAVIRTTSSSPFNKGLHNCKQTKMFVSVTAFFLKSHWQGECTNFLMTKHPITYVMQCAAVMTCCGVIKVPPQRILFILTTACHGQSRDVAFSP